MILSKEITINLLRATFRFKGGRNSFSSFQIKIRPGRESNLRPSAYKADF
jgi:hypothetical protein